MFLSLLLVTFIIAALVSVLVARVFKPALANILDRILSDPIHLAWVRYILFAIYVVGISSGVRVWDLEKYINPRISSEIQQSPLVLNMDRWVLEVYRTVIGTLQGISGMLLVFFILSLIAFIVVRVGEMKYGSRKSTNS